MKAWSDNATERLDAYLDEVRMHLVAAGDDAGETIGDLRAHIIQRIEECSTGLVTLNDLERVLAEVGTPEEVAGASDGLSAPAPRRAEQPAGGPRFTRMHYIVAAIVAAFLVVDAVVLTLVYNKVSRPTTVAARTNDGTYTADQIAGHKAEYFIERMEKPDPGYHAFSALWALQYKISTAQGDAKKQVIRACLDVIADPARSFQERFQCCYVVSAFDDPAVPAALNRVLDSDPDSQLRGVAACALGQTGTPESKSMLENALGMEQDPEVQQWIRRALAGEFTKPQIPEPAEEGAA